MLGRLGEESTARMLASAGWRILDRNWRCSAGELDIVAWEPLAPDSGTLVFVEVKTRRGLSYGLPQEAVDPRKLARLRVLAGAWLASHEVRAAAVRIDVVGVLVPRCGLPVVEHLRGVG